MAPDFRTVIDLAASGLPFHIVADRADDRSADRRRLCAAVAQGKTVLFPQIHQVLPRLMRLIVSLRATLTGPSREERSFLFAVEGRGRPGMGFHHDGDVDAVWLQLEGRRTVTLAPPVTPETPEDLSHVPSGAVTRDLDPGTLFYMPPHTPHRVVCHERSLALSLTWSGASARGSRRGRAKTRGRRGAAGPRADGASLRTTAMERYAESATAWDVVSGYARPIPSRSGERLWTQIPCWAGAVDRRRDAFPLFTPDGSLWLPAATRPFAQALAPMPSLTRAEARRAGSVAVTLIDRGILAPYDLPLLVMPDDVAALDGWTFA